MWNFDNIILKYTFVQAEKQNYNANTSYHLLLKTLRVDARDYTDCKVIDVKQFRKLYFLTVTSAHILAYSYITNQFITCTRGQESAFLHIKFPFNSNSNLIELYYRNSSTCTHYQYDKSNYSYTNFNTIILLIFSN